MDLLSHFFFVGSETQLASGVVACRLVDSVCPNILFMHRLRIDSATEYDFITNYKVLQDALTYLQVDKVCQLCFW